MNTQNPGGNAPVIDVIVEAGNWPDERFLQDLFNRSFTAACRGADLKFLKSSELSVLCTNDQAIQALNKQWRDKNKATNVLSFPASEPQDDVYGPLLGDIVFGFETVEREADELGIEFQAHLTHLVVHGILHLFDYDHQEDDEAELMESLEVKILSDLGLENPYIDRPLMPDA
ncbi:rRNA maturation RNase YbeY [Roseibium sp. RKSG952]|uniref:rRNA maturation RNase YbeY n=1 Tax=Roseibium sp. RKSG952 TaxID=2529384 RepID=UPI0012BC424E|nr:rRNA maturation RNase YbeY [Roseibium sp. RKSG952]MTH99731.1 rRNA maturation RNase YbeY [Roseibium sp. RKSG952]